MASNPTTGDEDAEAIISRGDERYCRGVASILNPHARYNSRSAVDTKEMIKTNITV